MPTSTSVQESSWLGMAPASPHTPSCCKHLNAAAPPPTISGVKVERRVALDRTGSVIAEKRLPQIMTSWDRLQRLLRETFDPAHYRLGSNFERVEQNGSGVRVHFSAGRVEHGDILVGGDGVRSRVRAAILPDVQPIYAGYYIWRGAPNEADLSPRALAEIFPTCPSSCRRSKR
jgi:2-polyprenyl-6-methoxyphenol hydroxylase-like FAD-dependent oxidoreductase